MKTWILLNGQVIWLSPILPFDQAYYPQNVQLPTVNRSLFFFLEKQVKVLWFAPRWRNLFNLTMHFLGNMGRGHTLAVQIKIQLDWKSHSWINDLHSPDPLSYVITVLFVILCKNFCCATECPFEILNPLFPVCLLDGWWWHGGGDRCHVAQGEMSPAGHVRHSGENDEDGEIPRWFLS